MIDTVKQQLSWAKHCLTCAVLFRPHEVEFLEGYVKALEDLIKFMEARP